MLLQSSADSSSVTLNSNVDMTSTTTSKLLKVHASGASGVVALGASRTLTSGADCTIIGTTITSGTAGAVTASSGALEVQGAWTMTAGTLALTAAVFGADLFLKAWLVVERLLDQDEALDRDQDLQNI